MTSSKISSAPTRSHSARSPSRNPGDRRDQAHVGGDRLDDHRGDRRRRARAPRCRGRPPCRPPRWPVTPAEPGRPSVGHGRAALDQQRVAVAVVVAGELHDRVAAGEPAGHADGAHGRLGAARHQAHLLDRRHPLDDGLGQAHLAGRSARRRTCRRPAASVTASTTDRVGVAEDDGAVGLHEVDVAVALDVPHVGALGPRDEVGRAADRAEGPHRRVHPAGDDPLAPLEQARRWCRSSRSVTSRGPRPGRGRSR